MGEHAAMVLRAVSKLFKEASNATRFTIVSTVPLVSLAVPKF